MMMIYHVIDHDTRGVARYFYLESILKEGLPCTDTAKVPIRTPNCTEICPILMHVCVLSQ